MRGAETCNVCFEGGIPLPLELRAKGQCKVYSRFACVSQNLPAERRVDHASSPLGAVATDGHLSCELGMLACDLGRDEEKDGGRDELYALYGIDTMPSASSAGLCI